VQMTSRGTHDRWRNRLILPVPLHYDTAVMKAIAVQTSADTHTTENKKNDPRLKDDKNSNRENN